MVHLAVLALMAAAAFLSYQVSHNVSFFRPEQSSPIMGLSLPSVGAASVDEPVLTSGVLPNTVRRDEVAAGLSLLSGNTASTETDAPAAAAGDAAGGAGEAGVAAAAEPVKTRIQYRLYTVREGDTASNIAARYSIDLQYLLWANPDLRDGELLTVGQMLVVPGGNGLLHDVRHGETLGNIAARYGVSVEGIMAWPGNEIASADQVIADQLVFVPEGVPPVTILPAATPVPTEEAPVVAPAPAPAPPPPAPVPAPVASTGLIWPVGGSISSYMDASHPLGIDIDLYNNYGVPIAASTSGTVTFAGGDPCCSYGLYVVVVSPNGIETVYAHLSSISVASGQTVSQGATLGLSGCTGYCTGTHLHFEVIDNGVRVNPLSYLP